MTELLYSGFHKIEAIKDDKGIVRERLILKSAAAAVVEDKEGKVCLVRQYRPAVQHETWEIPAGVLDKGLGALETMKEELQEECDINPEEVNLGEQSTSYYMVTGSSNAVMTIFHMHLQTKSVDKIIKNDDVAEVKWFTKQQLKEMVENNEIFDAKTLMALYRYQLIS